MAKSFPYQESLLQFIWANLLFETSYLKTIDGKSLTILDQGTLNSSDGPDFLNAHILIDGIHWYGAIEIHTKAHYWFHHGHDRDTNFDQVILHVIAEGDKQAICNNGDIPATLKISPYLNSHLSDIFDKFNKVDELACSGSITLLNENVIVQQLEKAKLEYFEKKVSDFYSFFPTEDTPSNGWKIAYIQSVFDVLGISKNRVAMQQVGKLCYSTFSDSQSFIDFRNRVHESICMLEKKREISWNYKGARPANHPKKRIEQGLRFTYAFLSYSFGFFLDHNCDQIWAALCSQSECAVQSQQFRLLYHIVHLPAMYALGSLLHKKDLIHQAHSLWRSTNMNPPSYFLRQFPTHQDVHPAHLGYVHQFNAYCKPRKCSECFILKSAIQS